MTWWISLITYTCIHWIVWCTLWFLQQKGINYDTTLVLVVLMIIDTIFGIWKSYRKWKILPKEKYNNWKIKNNRFSTRTMIDGIMKKLWVVMIPIIFAISLWSLWVTNNASIVILWLTRILISAELVSVFQNLYIFLTGDDIEEFDAIWSVLRTTKDLSIEIFRSIKNKWVDLILAIIKKK